MRKVKKAKWLVVLMVVAMLMSLVPAVGFAEPLEDECGECGPYTTPLIAGQNIEVGTVTVENDGEKICVTYALNDDALAEGWLIYETHLAIATEYDGIPQTSGNRWGTNPIPGQFPYGDDELEGVEEWSICIDLDEIDEDWEWGDCLFIAAHAVVERVECETLAEAPYGGSEVVDTLQAWRIDHTPEAPKYVRDQRSNPDNALELGIPGEETFYSLGYGGALNDERNAVEVFFGEYFEDRSDPDEIREMEGWVDEDLAAMLSDTENNAGWIIIEFDPAALNVEGEDDLQVIEDTWGLPYPLELAAVFARADAADDWTFLFLAHNQEPVGTPTYHTYTNGGLGELDEAAQILVQDVSDPEWFIPYPHSVETLDGYDLNAVLALNDHIVCEEFDETAWGEGDRFNERGNWGMFFKYKLCDPCVPASIIYGVAGSGGTGGLWEIEFTETGIEETLLINYNVSGDTYSGNGLAFDEENNRLYFAVTSGGKSDLYFYDFDGNIVEAATELPGTIYGATWGAGQYWYIPNGSDDMYTVSFDAEGKNGSAAPFEENFADGKSFNFGDIALDAEELVIYVSTSFSGANKEFFKYDLKKDEGERYSLITEDAADGAIGLQLAFGEDRVLYGHNTFGQNPDVSVSAREFFEVDKAGTASSLGIGENAYNDLASGPSICD